MTDSVNVPPRPPVLVIGAHRSGTTATARALSLLGLQVGQHLDSHLESRPMQKLHENYLQRCGAAWHDPAPFLNQLQTADGLKSCIRYLRENWQEDFPALLSYRRNLRGAFLIARIQRGRCWGWKEPRTTLFARCWLDLFPDARIIHVIRHPLAVATSMQRRELSFQQKGDAPTGRVQELAHCVDLAATYVQAGQELSGRTSFYRPIRFEDIQRDPAGTLSELALFCGLRFSSKQMRQAADTIRPDKSTAWRSLPEAAELLSHYPLAAKFGYAVSLTKSSETQFAQPQHR